MKIPHFQHTIPSLIISHLQHIILSLQKEDLHRELTRMGECLKDANAKNKTQKIEIEEHEKLFTNNQVNFIVYFFLLAPN